MALEPQKQSEEMLKAWSQKRRDAAGPRFEPHLAIRQLLLNETRRFHGQPQDEPERLGTFREFWSSLYPRLAVGLATVAVAGLAIWLISPQLAHNPTYTFASKTDREGSMPAERPATLAAPPASMADAQDETAKKKDAEVFQRLTRKPSLAPAESQPTVRGRLTAAKSVADNKDALIEKEVLTPSGTVVAKEEVESKFGAVVASGPATATAAYAPASPPAPGAAPVPISAPAPAPTDGAVSLGLNEAKKPEAKPTDGALAYSYGLEARADKDQSSTASTERLYKSPSVALRSELAATDTPALNPQVKLRDETNALTVTRRRMAGISAAQSQITQNIAGNRIQPISVAVQRFIQISPSVNAFRSQALQNGAANQAAANNAIVSNGLIAANGTMNQSSLGLLQRFDLEQNGSRISLVDADGSVYTGEWIAGDMDLGSANGQMNQAEDNLAVAGRQQGMGGGGFGGVGGTGAVKQYAPPRTEVYFHAEGVSQTLKQPVALRGFLELATTAPVVQNTQASSAQALNITRVQAQISMSTNAPTEVYAVPVKP